MSKSLSAVIVDARERERVMFSSISCRRDREQPVRHGVGRQDQLVLRLRLERLLGDGELLSPCRRCSTASFAPSVGSFRFCCQPLISAMSIALISSRFDVSSLFLHDVRLRDERVVVVGEQEGHVATPCTFEQVRLVGDEREPAVDLPATSGDGSNCTGTFVILLGSIVVGLEERVPHRLVGRLHADLLADHVLRRVDRLSSRGS